MIERYTRPVMAGLWNEQHKFETWLRVELAVCEAWARRGTVPEESVQRIRQKARVNVERIKEIESTVHHDVIAFLTQIGETVGDDARYIHYGLTSSDVVDTAAAVIMSEALEQVQQELKGLRRVTGDQARRYRDLPMPGRTHGMQAEPTSFGHKLALWWSELGRNERRLEQALKQIRVGKLSGAVGTYANVPPDLEAEVCESLGLAAAPVSSQIVQRDRHAEVVWALTATAATLEKMATEIRGLQRTEIGEAAEPFRSGQKGSSAMPHKRNPIICERVSGLARVLRGQLSAALENVALWHERDISHSSVERIILPGSTALLDYMLDKMRFVIENLEVYPERMKANLELTRGLVFSQQLLLALVEAGAARDQAYQKVQSLAMDCWQQERDFAAAVHSDPWIGERLSQHRIDQCFDLDYQLRHEADIFQRLGLE